MEEVGEGSPRHSPSPLGGPFAPTPSAVSIVERRPDATTTPQRQERSCVMRVCSAGGARGAATGLNYFYVPSRDGGTGRRSGLKIRRGQPRGGSTPPPGTNETNYLAGFLNKNSSTGFTGVPNSVPTPRLAISTCVFASLTVSSCARTDLLGSVALPDRPVRETLSPWPKP